MGEQASFNARRQNDATVFSISGEIDILNAAELRAAMLEATSAGGAFIVSLTDVAYFDSQTLEALVELSKRLVLSRRRMSLVAPQECKARRLLDVSGISKVIPTFETVDAALVALSPSTS